MNIITKYDLGKGSNDKKVLFSSDFVAYVDLIGLEMRKIGNTRLRNKICTKTIYPLFNGGINRITVSSDLLATSQYINGHKTAAIAELQIGPSTNAQINPMEIQDSFDWKHKFFFSQWECMNNIHHTTFQVTVTYRQVQNIITTYSPI